MKRREFILGSVAAAVVASLPGQLRIHQFNMERDYCHQCFATRIWIEETGEIRCRHISMAEAYS